MFYRSWFLVVGLLMAGLPSVAHAQAADPALTQVLKDYASTVSDAVARGLCSLVPQLPSKNSQQAVTDDRLGSYMKASAGFRSAAAMFAAQAVGEGPRCLAETVAYSAVGRQLTMSVLEERKAGAGLIIPTAAADARNAVRLLAHDRRANAQFLQALKSAGFTETGQHP